MEREKIADKIREFLGSDGIIHWGQVKMIRYIAYETHTFHRRGI